MITDKGAFLSGKFLVSLDKDDDDVFAKSVVYICSHDKDGAMGFVINKKLKDFSFSDLAVKMPFDMPLNVENMFLYQGGPVEKIRGFVLHSADYFKEGTYRVNEQIAVSSSLDILTDIACGVGPKQNLIALGYSGWQAHQIEQEIMQNRWLISNANADLMFNTPDDLKWERAMDESGIDLTRYIPTTGFA